MNTLPIRVDSHNGPWPLFDRAGSQALEAAALSQHAPGELMQRAGLAAARLVVARWPHARRVLVLAGPGNNGGDGWVLAQHLHGLGRSVVVFPTHADGSGAPTDASEARRLARAAGVPEASSAIEAVEACDLVIDALLGLGSTGPARGAVADGLRALHTARARRPGLPVLALDLPSGLDVDTGQPWPDRECAGASATAPTPPQPPAPVPATATLSLLALRPGLFTGSGRDLCGEVWFTPLGVSPDLTVTPVAELAGPPAPRTAPHAWHKGRRGDLWVVGGAPGMEGAALLAADAAARAGAGRVLLRFGPSDGEAGTAARLGRAPHLLALAEAHWRDDRALAGATVVAGCGGGPAMAMVLPRLLALAPRLVLDADALNAVAATPDLRMILAGRAARGQHTALTPHPLEAARLLDSTVSAVQAHRLMAAQRLADDFGAAVVLKGSGSVIAVPQSRPVVNPSGNAALATAGSGDVLAGWLGALWAQAPDGPLRALCSEAVWRHGDAADHWAAAGHAGPLPASELARWMSSPVPQAARG